MDPIDPKTLKVGIRRPLRTPMTNLSTQVADLKAELSRRGLDAAGLKADLVQRLQVRILIFLYTSTTN